MDKGEKYLPVGTVCLLQDGSKKIMITGFCVKSPDVEGKEFDYIGCLYPEGVISSDQNLLFNHDQIVQVFYKGYECEEETEFKAKLKEFVNGNAPAPDAAPAPAEAPVETLDSSTPDSI